MQAAGAASAKTTPAFPEAGERILWEGRPRVRAIGLAPDERAPGILTLGWFGIASYALLWGLDRGVGAAWTAAVAWVPAGFLLVNARRLLARHRARRARGYVLTDRRVVWLEGGRVVRGLPLAAIAEASVHGHGGGTGTVVLGPTSRAAEVLRRSGPRAKARAALAPALEDIKDAEAVYALIRGALGA